MHSLANFPRTTFTIIMARKSKLSNALNCSKYGYGTSCICSSLIPVSNLTLCSKGFARLLIDKEKRGGGGALQRDLQGII